MAYYRYLKAEDESTMYSLYCDHCAVVDGWLPFTVDEFGDYWSVYPWRWSPHESDTVCQVCGNPCLARRIGTHIEPKNIVSSPKT
jgi:hypothetical protein